jgi:TRAP transporter 4TM/12TM fusion protein
MDRIRPGSFWFILWILFSFLMLFVVINQIFNLHLFGFKPLDNSYLYYVIAFSLSFVFPYYPAMKSAPKDRIPWYDTVLFLLTVIINIYLALNGMNIISLGWEYNAPFLPTLCSVFLWGVVLEAVRRVTDLSMTLFCLLCSVVPLFADYLPGVLKGLAFDFPTSARLHAMGLNSILGIPLYTVCTLLIGFMIFGVLLQKSGGGAFFLKIAQSMLGDKRGGAAKMGILGSSFFGMLSGSTVSNVLTIGSMTIPAMKRTGYSAQYAAAIESCASAGGPIMPPVMGAAAFVMASFLSIPYYQVAIGAAIPACLYYLGLFIQVDGYAAKNGLKGLSRSELPPFWNTLKEGWFYFLVIVVLCYFLLTLRVEAWAPFFASAVLLILSMIQQETRLTWPKILGMVLDSGKVIMQMTAILAAAGLLIGGLSVTGIALAFSRELVILAENNILLILIVGGITSFILGLGMTTTACYIFLAIVMAPALVKLGIDPLAAHLFVFYWGALSELTPPTALCVAAACGISGSEFMPTSWQAMKLGAVKYIVPFFFVYSPALLTHGPWTEILFHTFFAVLGITVVASALEGYFIGLGVMRSMVHRVVLLIGGMLIAFPEIITTMIGFLIIAASIGLMVIIRKKAAAARIAP